MTTNIEFKPWPKIKRDNPLTYTITEKMDGANVAVIIQNGEVVGCQSRKHLITIDDDNYGFAQWVFDNRDELTKLGDGHHFGEWCGPGIQKNPHCFDEKRFYLFNTYRWRDGRQPRPTCCHVVPILFEGVLESDTIECTMTALREYYATAVPYGKPEGVICYNHSSQTYTKHTYKKGHKHER